MSLLGIHARGDGVTAVVVGDDGAVLATAHRPVGVLAGEHGAVEHAPDEVWRATLAATGAVLARVDPGGLRGLGLADDDTLVLWDRETLGAPRPAVDAADRRAGSTTLADRLAWLAAHEPRTWALVEAGEYAVGGPASYLLARLTRGTWHAADPGWAARTGLLDLGRGAWSPAACADAGVPGDALPELVATWGSLDRTDARSFHDLALPVTALAAAGTATLLGRGGGRVGEAAWSDGSLLVLTDEEPTTGPLRASLAWRGPDGRLAPALTADLAEDDVVSALADVPGAALRAAGRDDDAARGAGYLAGLGAGTWAAPDELPPARRR